MPELPTIPAPQSPEPTGLSEEAIAESHPEAAKLFGVSRACERRKGHERHVAAEKAKHRAVEEVIPQQVEDWLM